MERIKRKALIGFVFATMALLVNVGVKFYHHINMEFNDVGFNFILFFLIGYVVLGNLFANKKAN